MKKHIQIYLFVFLFLLSCSDQINSPFQENDQLPVMEIKMTNADFHALSENRMHDREVPIIIYYKGEKVEGLIRASGAGSRYFPKWSYKVTLTNGLVESFDEFNLSAQTFDKTMMNTAIASAVYRKAGFPVFKSSHIFLRINNEDSGLFVMTERVEREFFENRNLKVAELFKLGFDSKFTFNVTNNPESSFEKKIPDDDNFNSLYEFINALDTCNISENINGINKFLKVSNYLRYHSVTSILGNIDAFTNNFFLVKENPESNYHIVPWDFDKCFSETDNSKLYGDNEIIRKLLQNEELFSIYKNNTALNINRIFKTNLIPNIIDSLSTTIRTGFNNDQFLGDGRYNFDVEIQKLQSYIERRTIDFETNLRSFTFEKNLENISDNITPLN